MKYLIIEIIIKFENWNCPYCGREDCGADCGGQDSDW